jgi:gas vesicle protein
MDETNSLSRDEERIDGSWKARALVIGGLLGAITGVGAAFLLTKRAEQQGKELDISPGKGVQLGVMIVGLLRSILSLGED